MTFIGSTLADASGIILAVDGAVADLLQRPERDIVGRSYLEFTHEADWPDNTIRVESLRSGDAPSLIRKHYRRADGSLVLIDLGVSRFGGHSDSGRLVGCLHRPAMADAPSVPFALWRTAQRLLSMERIRERELGGDLFGGRAWAILLNTYIVEAEGGTAEISDLSSRTGQPPDMLARWLKALRADGLLEAADGYGLFWQLTPLGARRIEALLARVDQL